MLLEKLKKANLIHPPPYLVSNTMYLTYMGSHAYGVQKDDSDYDVYGWVVPPKHIVFPINEIRGFDEPTNFEEWQQHHIMFNGKEYDLKLFNITKFFALAMKATPNIIDSLWTPENCIIQCSPIGRLVRDRRKIFLSKKIWNTMRGYAFSQLSKAQFKEPEGKRKASFDEFGYDPKFLYHTYRLVSQAEQLLESGDMNLQLHSETMKAIRRGEMSLKDVIDWFNEKSKQLDKLYETTTLPALPNRDKVRDLLLQCLDMHYETVDDVIERKDFFKDKLREVDTLLEEIRGKLYS